MTSIRHFPATHPIPDWRNFGVLLRVMLGVNGLAALAALLQADRLVDWPARFVDLAALLEPVLLILLGLLALLRDVLWRLQLRLARLAVLGLSAVVGAGIVLLAQDWHLAGPGGAWRAAILAAALATLVLGYFSLRSRAISPAQAEARLAALNARIRPHFLFNTLNAVLSLIRARPQQAEEALESLSDLFRAALRDPADLVSLADEVALGRQYLALERLRLGERLHEDWQVDAASLAIPIPPLMLQPLLENAVYHGVEPRPEGGCVTVSMQRRGDELHILIGNPTAGQAAHAAGNRMAVENIRERLALVYDLEARLHAEIRHDRYEIRIVLPCRRHPSR